VVLGIKKIGFSDVIEVALGADMVAISESKELAEKGFLTSSCCPAFVDFVKKNHPNLAKYVSNSFSPMVTLAKHLKKADPAAKFVFIGPCTAKKMEIQLEGIRPYVDLVLTFEELQAFFDALAIDLSTLGDEPIGDASPLGRNFAQSGGVSGAVKRAMEDLGIIFDLKPVPCSGIEACGSELVKIAKGVPSGNFLEGMACCGGCLGGAGCIAHGVKDKFALEKYAKASGKTLAQTTAEIS
jgi:iron only hydrogenase large subunit-like protein